MNILLNTYCNLQCPYCFADNEITTCDNKNMSLENFETIIQFMKKNNIREVRLLGGEPTLHPYFPIFLHKIANDTFFDSIHIFSNMTFNADIRDIILAISKIKQITILPNFNEIQTVKDKNSIIINNIEILSQNNIINTIGINIYKPDMKLDFLFNLLDKINIKRVRWAITVPNLNTNKNLNIKEYFHSFYPLLINFFKELNCRHITHSLDCNYIPLCVFNDNELATLIKVAPNLFGAKENHCDVVLDINPKLEAFQCFGLSDQFKINITNTTNISQISQLFLQKHKFLYDKVLFDDCYQCEIYKLNNNNSCSCLAYRK